MKVHEDAHIHSRPAGGPTDVSSNRRRTGSLVLAAAFALLALADAWQLLEAARGRHPDPPLLLVLHGMTGAFAGAVAAGSWRGRRWAALAALGWGGLTAAMLVALGPVLDTPPAERPQLWVGAAVVAVAAAASAWYLDRRHESAATGTGDGCPPPP